MFATKFVDIKTQFLTLQNIIFIYDCEMKYTSENIFPKCYLLYRFIPFFWSLSPTFLWFPFTVFHGAWSYVLEKRETSKSRAPLPVLKYTPLQARVLLCADCQGMCLEIQTETTPPSCKTHRAIKGCSFLKGDDRLDMHCVSLQPLLICSDGAHFRCRGTFIKMYKKSV